MAKVPAPARSADWMIHSSAALHFRRQNAVFVKVWIIIQPRDFQAAKLKFFPVRVAAIRFVPSLELRDFYTNNARHGLSEGVKPALINGLAEGQIVRVEKAGAAVAHDPVAEQFQQ